MHCTRLGASFSDKGRNIALTMATESLGFARGRVVE
jgi:hypothetical protein